VINEIILKELKGWKGYKIVSVERLNMFKEENVEQWLFFMCRMYMIVKYMYRMCRKWKCRNTKKVEEWKKMNECWRIKRNKWRKYEDVSEE
jgi:hypothetical protein